MTANSVFEPAGRAIPYIEEGEGPVSLVLIPGTRQDGAALGVVAHYLAEEAGFRVVRIGSRGELNGAEDAVSLEERVEDLAAVMDHIGLTKTWVGGHGFGGTVARAFALDRTDRMNGLLLLGVEEREIPLAPAIPVLIVQGAEDEVTPPAQGERLKTTASDRASVTTIPGADHLFPTTHPVETAVVIEEYLDWD
ncbi:pimeloyl-ACP methyl ester carboxylesterase [Microbacterium resistens]|uniref:Pimeloyl-ACP methyl ester carboxylesterase n=1 Tax=Microbacterium resistens TaxID=156977 RepID=A0ABU1S9K5_9MICO|nr:alpha/beta hydrolase [Microbacterium resistens]MDR6865583.1 pimeloyl-ACP methyl ester carboxylesterase [Microbacterium resistens]